MRWPAATAVRCSLRAAAALAGAFLAAACTAGTGSPASGSHPATQRPVAAPADGCLQAGGDEPFPGGKIVLGVISLGPDLLQPTVRVHEGWWLYWQKHGLWLRAGHQTVTITVPKAWRNRAAITWGANVGIVSTLRFPSCPSGPGTLAGPGRWGGYAGGFYLRSSYACVPLVVAVERRSAVIRVSVGRRCRTVP